MKVAVSTIWLVLFSVTGNVWAQQIFRKSKSNTKILVVVFLGVDCPISQNYVTELNRISEQYLHELSIIGVIPDRVKRSDLTKFKSDYHVKFRVEKDPHFKIAKRFVARITPEAFLYDKHGVLRYRGAIDNWYYELGKHRQQATRHYLIDGIVAILKGEDPTDMQTEPIGCIIQIR